MIVTNKFGRIFDLVGEEPYTRKDGTTTSLKVWMADCAVCGQPFMIKTPQYASTNGDSKAFGRKHCNEHKISNDQVSQKRADRIDGNASDQASQSQSVTNVTPHKGGVTICDAFSGFGVTTCDAL